MPPYTKRSLGRPARKPKPPALPVDHPPVLLLRQAGATDAVVAEVQRAWGELDYDERVKTADSLRALTTDELKLAVLYTESTLADVQLSDDELRRVGALLDDVPDGRVPDVEAWADEHGKVGAVAALLIELRRPHDRQRKTLIEGLRERVDS